MLMPPQEQETLVVSMCGYSSISMTCGFVVLLGFVLVWIIRRGRLSILYVFLWMDPSGISRPVNSMQLGVDCKVGWMKMLLWLH